MAYIEPTLIEAKVNTMEQKVTKTNKAYMLVNFADGLRAAAWDQHLWPILMNAQTHDATLQVWYIRNNMGYYTITNLAPLPGAIGGEKPGNGGGGEHFIKGAGDQQTPALPAPPAPPAPTPPSQRRAPDSTIKQADRVQLCLAVSMMAWGGVMVKNQEEYFKWLRNLERYAETGMLPGEKPPVEAGGYRDGDSLVPVHEGPEYGT